VPISYEELQRIIEADQPPLFPPFCLVCGYDLRGSPSGRCPECGRGFIKGEWKKELVKLKRAANELRDANEWAERAVVIAIVAAVAGVLGAVLSGTCFGLFLKVVGVIGGATAALLGAAVFRADRLPEWAGGYGPPPRREHAVACIVLGAVAIAASVVFL